MDKATFLANVKYKNNYDYAKVPDVFKMTDKVTVTCPKHGSFSQLAHSHQHHGCPACGKESMIRAKQGVPAARRFTLKQAIDKAKLLYPDIDYSQVKTYDPAGNWTLRCPEHGVFSVKVRSHLWDGCRGCKQCKVSKQTDTTRQQFYRVVKSFGYKLVKYTLSQEPCELKCPKHGSFVIAKAYYLTQGDSCCPTCRRGSSVPEVILKTAFPSANLHRRDLITPNEIDLYWPEHRLAVEVNGIYWHKGKDKDYHVGKTLQCKKLKIQLLHFWDYEISEKPALVKSMIAARLGQSKRLYARKLEVVKLEAKEAKQFLNENHLQGNTSFSVAYGLKNSKGRLAMVITFGKPRFDKTAEWELIRLATHRGLTVVGGASRLLRAFERSHNPKSLVSYADLRYSQGGVYKELGFKLQRRTPPNYQWVYGTQRLSRYQTQKHKLAALLGDSFQPKHSEYVNMTEAGYLQIHDCGNLVYRKNYGPSN